ncbi:alpha-ketoglutarate-dependent dioxygenase AlkB [Aureispira sp. CCB-E]|uniref:alpha-ketoglutarate-dependent dioxygenase AlkB family protein n=1 Tax=Aureispira sp. CCB-E TaxID=3051121 RepID=UPI002868590E|nr:alpha-ketoglutarate-dependent dioxygenase AlkB [Aureispira sp. CCB-E]WMX17158.1 alpha-ketoglutarate-dependent dioxygenase AlkB [Aureispira sp. CCB-E]
MDLFNQNNKPKPREFKKHILKDGEVWFMPNFMPLDKAASYYKIFQETINWRQEEIKYYGKIYPIPRKTAWYGYEGFNYKYSGIMCNPEPWTKELMEIKRVIEYFMPKQDFNSVLLNMYRDGTDKVSWHADDEKGLGINPTIASVSLGAVRRFDLKHKHDKDLKLQIELTPGSLIVMTGSLQHNWLHQIPVQKRIKETRINLTYRTIVS